MINFYRIDGSYVFGLNPENDKYRFIKRQGNQMTHLDKNKVLKRVAAEGVPADHAGQLTSFIEKSVELALQEKKYEDYKILFKHGGRFCLIAGFCLMAFSFGAVFLKELKLDTGPGNAEQFQNNHPGGSGNADQA